MERTLQERNREIARLALTDPLTGLYNRRYLTEKLSLELKRVQRYNRPLSVILCDIDHFKRVNDTYGHGVGDLVLREFAGWLKGAIRDGVDWPARYGGEEFVLVLPETDLGGSWALAERLRRLVADKLIATPAGDITLTASFGISAFTPGEGKNPPAPETLLEEADDYLYQAKKGGRNRVAGPVMASGSAPHLMNAGAHGGQGGSR